MPHQALVDNLEVITEDNRRIALIEKLFLSLTVNGRLHALSSEFESAEVRELGQVCDLYQPKTISTSQLIPNGEFPVYGANGVIGRFTQFNHEDSEVLVTCRGATCGTVNVSQPYSWINGNAMVIRPKNSSLRKDFLALVLRSIDYKAVITGTAQPQITKAPLANVNILIPSLSAQEIVVNTMQSISDLLSNLGAKSLQLDLLRTSFRKSAVNAISVAQSQEEFYTALNRIQDNLGVIAGTPDGIESLRKKILAVAVGGKLSRSSQFEEDSDSLLPQGWELKEFSDVANFSIGKTPPTKETKYWGGDDSIVWVSIGDMVDGGQVRETARRVSLSAQSEIFRRSPWPSGTLLMSFKLTIGKMARLAVPAFFNEAIIAFDSGNETTNEFLFRVLPFISQNAESKGAIKGNTLNSQSIREMLIPIPPIEEQSRLVNVIDGLNQLCNQLESQLSTKTSIAERLARSVVSQSAQEVPQ